MNRDEIEKMEAGCEMDALIAETILLKIPCDKWRPFNYDSFFNDECKHDCYPVNFPPHYSTDISAAWEMEAKIYDDGSAVDYINNLIFIVNREEGLTAVGDWLQYFKIAHATPSQRCRAALMTKSQGRR